MSKKKKPKSESKTWAEQLEELKDKARNSEAPTNKTIKYDLKR